MTKKQFWSRARRVAVAIAIAATAQACSWAESGDDADGDATADVKRARCAQLRDHLADVDVQYVAVDRDAHRAAAAAVLGDGFVDQCVHDQSLTSVACGIRARTLDEAAGCTHAEVTP